MEIFKNKKDILNFAKQDMISNHEDTYKNNKSSVDNFFNEYYGKGSTGLSVDEHLKKVNLDSSFGISDLNTRLSESLNGTNPDSVELMKRVTDPLDVAKSRKGLVGGSAGSLDSKTLMERLNDKAAPNSLKIRDAIVTGHLNSLGEVDFKNSTLDQDFLKARGIQERNEVLGRHANTHEALKNIPYDYNTLPSEPEVAAYKRGVPRNVSLQHGMFDEQRVQASPISNNPPEGSPVKGGSKKSKKTKTTAEPGSKVSNPGPKPGTNTDTEVVKSKRKRNRTRKKGKNANIAGPTSTPGEVKSPGTRPTFTPVTTPRLASPFIKEINGTGLPKAVAPTGPTFTPVSGSAVGYPFVGATSPSSSIPSTKPPFVGPPAPTAATSGTPTSVPAGSASAGTTPPVEPDTTPESWRSKAQASWDDLMSQREDADVEFIASRRKEEVKGLFNKKGSFDSKVDLEEHVRDTLKNNPEAAETLDRESFSRVKSARTDELSKDSRFTKSSEREGKAPKTLLDKLFNKGVTKEVQTEVTGNPYLTEKNARYLNKKQLNKAVDQAENQSNKDQGKGLGRFSSEGGYGHSLAQAKAASAGERLGAFLSHANIFGGSSRESLLNNLGILTADQKVQLAKAGGFNKLLTKTLTGGTGLFIAYSALQSDDPGNELIASTAAGWGMMQGWKMGSSFGSFLHTSHVSRVGFGAVGSVGTAVIGYGAVKSFADLTSNESVIVDYLKSTTSREVFAKSRDSDLSLTLRQAAMQKLSASSLNNRGQLLGNEAQILRGGYATA